MKITVTVRVEKDKTRHRHNTRRTVTWHVAVHSHSHSHSLWNLYSLCLYAIYVIFQLWEGVIDLRWCSCSAIPTRTPVDSPPDSVFRSIFQMDALSFADLLAACPMDASSLTYSVSLTLHYFTYVIVKVFQMFQI